ncbi:MAG: hypothetical protein LQ350_004994 [Teloschistes chrysophthalmus]|nr:MAG: hypothetical protein LQ350_004994 [Niorma chrysophthalma]
MESREQFLSSRQQEQQQPSSQQQEQQQPSVADIIDWHIEQCQDLSELGYSINPAIKPSTNPSLSSYWHDSMYDDNWADLVLDDLNGYIKETAERKEYIKTHPALAAETQQEVHRRLAAAGKSQSDIESYDAEKIPLRLRILDLHNLENGWFLGDKKTVPVLLRYVYRGVPRNVSINLDPRDSFLDFEDNAKSCLSLQSLQYPDRKLEVIYHEGRPWRYGRPPRTLISPIGKGFCTIRSARDYQNLIMMVLKHGRTVVTQEEEQNAEISTTRLESDEQKEMATLSSSTGLDEAFRTLSTGGIDMDNGAFLADSAAEARAQKTSNSNEEMTVSRARHDQARVAHDNDRRARRAESLVPKDRHILQTRASRERSMTETGPLEQMRKDGHGPQTRAAMAAAAAGQVRSPEGKRKRVAGTLGEAESPIRRKSQRIAAASSSKLQSPPNEGTETPMGWSGSKRGRGKAADASPSLSPTQSGKQRKQ